MTLVLLRSSGMVPTRTARRCWQLPRQLQRPSQAHLLETKTSINQSICSRGAHLPWKYMFRYLSISAPCLARRNRTPGQPTHTRDDENLRGTESDNGGSTHVTDEQRDLIARELALMLGVSDAEARAMIEDEHGDVGISDHVQYQPTDDDDVHFFDLDRKGSMYSQEDPYRDVSGAAHADRSGKQNDFSHGDEDMREHGFDGRRYEDMSRRRGGRLDLDKFVQDERLAAVFGKGTGSPDVNEHSSGASHMSYMDEKHEVRSSLPPIHVTPWLAHKDGNIDAEAYTHSLGAAKPDPTTRKELVKFRLGGIPQPGSGIGEFGARGNIRSRRISGAIQRTINEALHRGELGTDLLALGLEIESVEFGKGLRKADIWWHSTQNEEKDFLLTVAIREQARAIRRVVAQKMNMKFTPEFKWRVTTVRTDEKEIDEMFAQVCKEISAYDARLEKEELTAKMAKKNRKIRSQSRAM